ncbi:MAG TPA: D-2-hydroxyacid dehydrogenase [Anaerolineae bacterium]|nr:D-2-hydroxyacid dehydrogenase [Anaerolineae bacterium]
MTKILLGYARDGVPPGALEQVRKLAPHMEVLVTEDRSEIEHALHDIEIAARRFPHDLVMQAPKLRWLQQWGAGADWLLRYPEVRDREFTLTNASGVHAIPITEHILAVMLSFARQLHHAVRAQLDREWDRPNRGGFSPQQPIFELHGKTLLLIGVGAIGQRTAEVASAIGMRVLGARRNPGQAVPGVEAMYGPHQLFRVLPEADFVVLTVPLTPDTRGLIGEPELRAIRPDAYLINIGRGGTIQEDKLAQALREGWIAGAGLDVFESEPLPADSPLWQMENVIITAHYAGLTPHYEQRALDIFLDNLARYVAGESLRNIVDKDLVY